MPIGKIRAGRIGETRKITCPTCEGEGRLGETDDPDDDKRPSCNECSGSGFIEATIVKQ